MDDLCFELAIAAGAYPSPLGYGSSANPFPAALCVSRNDIICHGIPDDEALVEGDIVSLDVTVFREGVHGDTCATLQVGQVNDDAAALIAATKRALIAGINAVEPGAPLSVIGAAIEAVAEAANFSVVRDFVGHGIGGEFHSAPHIPHYRHTSRLDLRAGMTFTIEPMIATGTPECLMLDDGWTAATADGGLCAQFEHTIYVGEGGAEVLTRLD